MERLAGGLMTPLHERLEVVDDLRQAIQSALGAEKLPVAARRVAGHGRPRLDVADHAPLHGHAGAPSDGDVVGEARPACAEHAVLDVRTPGDPRLSGDQPARADAAVGPIATGSRQVVPRPTIAVGCTHGSHAGSGYSTGMTDSKATCGSRTTTRHGGPSTTSADRSGLQSTMPALEC